MQIVNAGKLIDEGDWSGYQTLLIVGTTFSVIAAGIDNQLFAQAIPKLMSDWSVTRDAFVRVLLVSSIGILFGHLFGGMLGDRIGRRSALLISVLTFGSLTLAMSTGTGISMLTLLRFLAGLGMGGTLSNAVALAFESVPIRSRAIAVSLTMIWIPFSSFFAAGLSERILPNWKGLFLLGGTIPIVLAFVLFKVLPESPRYLASRRERWPELIALLRRLGHTLPSDVVFAESGSTELRKSKASIRDLFAPAFRLDTFALLGSFFFCRLANNIGSRWLPAMLVSVRIPDAGSAPLWNWNLAGVAGALLGAFIILRLGSRITMLGMASAAIVCAVVLTTMRIEPKDTFGLMVMLVLLGGFVNAVQSTMYTLAANAYPTAIRGSGIGAALAMGRIGIVVAGLVGDFVLNKGGAPAYFWSLALVMALTFVSLALVRRHIERAPRPLRVPGNAARASQG